jgi:hypothetical protein
MACPWKREIGKENKEKEDAEEIITSINLYMGSAMVMDHESRNKRGSQIIYILTKIMCRID